jgi:predicted nucleotidyltransferase
LLVEFSRPTGLFGLVSLQLFLEEKFSLKVDIGTFASLKPYVREEVEKDVQLVA